MIFKDLRTWRDNNVLCYLVTSCIDKCVCRIRTLQTGRWFKIRLNLKTGNMTVFCSYVTLKIHYITFILDILKNFLL